MTRTLKETITSLKDKSYGSVIISKRLKSVVWYWTKYLLLLTFFPILLFVFLLTYYLPQLPRAIKDTFPEGEISVKDGRFSTTFAQPFVVKDPSFTIIVDPLADPAALDQDFAGLFVNSSQIFIKAPDGRIQNHQFTSRDDFSLSKQQVLDWVSAHQSLLWLIGFSVILGFAVITSAGYWLLGVSLIIFFSLILLLLPGSRSAGLDYRGALKLSLYASVIPMFMFTALSFLPPPALALLVLVLFFYISTGWISHLPQIPKRNP